jgi:hypothetical protein
MVPIDAIRVEQHGMLSSQEHQRDLCGLQLIITKMLGFTTRTCPREVAIVKEEVD